MMYERQSQKVLHTLPALAVPLLLMCKVACAATTPVFSYPTGFSGASAAFATVADAATFSGSQMQVANGAVGQHEAGAVWYKTQQNVSSFTTSFTFTLPNTGVVPSIAGMTFCIQNSNSTTNPADQWGN